MNQAKQKEQISAIMHAVVNRKPRYWLDGAYVRWGRIELDLHATAEGKHVDVNDASMWEKPAKP